MTLNNSTKDTDCLNSNIRRSQDNFFKIYKICIFIFFINSMHPWFLMGIPTVFISLFFLIPTVVAFQKGDFRFKPDFYLSMGLCTLMFLWMARDGSFFGILDALLKSFLFTTIICLDRIKFSRSISFITKALGIILLVSSFFYILYRIGIPLPHNRIVLPESTRIEDMDNYYFFVAVRNIFGMPRFNSIFLEPGYLTLGVTPLLFIYKYNIKNKYVLILLFCQILSFSLAGLILLVLGYLLSVLCGKAKFKKLTIGIICASIIGFLSYHLLGEEYITEHVLVRIALNDDGTLAGDDRSSDYLDSEFERLMASSNKWTGTTFDASLSEKGVSGYKLFTVQNGIIGVILVILTYLSFISIKRIGINYSTCLIGLCLLLLYQNSYPEASCILISAISSRFVFDSDSQLLLNL